MDYDVIVDRYFLALVFVNICKQRMSSLLEHEEVIRKQIEDRNKLYNKFSTLILSHSKLCESNKELQSLNTQLKAENGKLQKEKQELEARANATLPAVDRSEHATALEHKLYKVQEELTEVHRTKGARAQQIIDLNMALQEKEKELTEVHQKLQEKHDLLEIMKKQLNELEQQNAEQQQGNVVLKDEYEALQITSDAVEEKLRRCQVENQTLIERWLHFKDKEAKAINQENDQIQHVLVRKSSNKPELSGEGGNPTSPKPASSSPPSASTSPPNSAGSTFKDKLSSFFGVKSRSVVQEEHHPTSYLSAQYYTDVHLPEEVVCKWRAHESEVTATRFFSSGGRLATGGSDKLINIWNFVGDKPRLQSTLRGCNGGVTSIDFDTQEHYVAASSSDFACRLWAVNTQRLKLTLTGHCGAVCTSKFLSSSHRLVSGSRDRTIKVWDASSGACTRTFMAGSSCLDVVAADSAECVASGHFDKKIRIWDARVGNQVQNEITVGGRVTSLDMPLDKTLLICCTKDHTLELIDIRKNSVLSVFNDDAFKVAADMMRCAFSIDGKYVSVGSCDGTVLSWNVKTGERVSLVKEHNDPVLCCNWSCGRLISGDKNKNCILWTDS